MSISLTVPFNFAITLLDDHLFAVDDVDAWGQGACFGGVVCHFHAVEVVDGLAEFV